MASLLQVMGKGGCLFRAFQHFSECLPAGIGSGGEQRGSDVNELCQDCPDGRCAFQKRGHEIDQPPAPQF